MRIVRNHAIRLQRVNEVVQFGKMPIHSRIFARIIRLVFFGQLVPFAVEPNPCYFAVVCEQFRKLVFHELNVGFPFALFGAPCTLAGAPVGMVVVGAVPINQRVIEHEFDVLPTAFVCQLLYEVFAVRRVHDVPIRVFGVPIAEPVVVARG